MASGPLAARSDEGGAMVADQGVDAIAAEIQKNKLGWKAEVELRGGLRRVLKGLA